MTIHNWMIGAQGEAIDLESPRDTPIHIETIATVLARIPRWGGHTLVPYSVAAHSVHVSVRMGDRYGKEGAIMGLLHDAHEAYIGDVTTPLKRILGSAFADLEHDWEARVRGAFDCDGWGDDEVCAHLKHCDLIALSTERAQLLPPAAYDASRYAWADDLPPPDTAWHCRAPSLQWQPKVTFLAWARQLGLTK